MDNEPFFEPRIQRPVRDYAGRDLGSMDDLQQAGLVIIDSRYQALGEVSRSLDRESRQEPIYKHLG